MQHRTEDVYGELPPSLRRKVRRLSMMFDEPWSDHLPAAAPSASRSYTCKRHIRRSWTPTAAAKAACCPSYRLNWPCPHRVARVHSDQTRQQGSSA